MKDRTCILFIVFCIMLIPDFMYSQVSVDSVRNELLKMPEDARLQYLDAQINDNQHSYSRLVLAHLLREEALKQQNDEYLANAYFTLVRHFYSDNTDSMRYWIAESGPLYLRLGRLEDYFRMQTWDIYMFAREGDKNNALEAVEHLRKLSNEYSFPEGVEMADQAMANFYFLNKNYAEGEELYLDVLNRMEKRGAPMIKKVYILRQLFIYVPSVEKRLEYLGRVENYIKECKAAGIELLDKENYVYSWEYVIHRNYAQEYMKIGQLDKAWKHLRLAEELSKEYDIFAAKRDLAYLYNNYYTKTGESSKALPYMNQIEKELRGRGHYTALIEFLKNKANLFKSMGDWEKTVATYEEYIQLNDSINKVSFEDKVAEMQIKYQVEKLELEKRQAEIETKQTHAKMIFLFCGCVILLVAVGVLIYMLRVIHRNRIQLKLAKEKAEEADIQKSMFLANMNHEIRTPLNAIVGFSQVLVEEEDMESRKEYANIIQNNNEQLQRLIADVLDISKLESNSMSLLYSEQDIPEIMWEINNVIRLRVPSEIQLILDPCEPFLFETDKNRLVQILTNLLTNAIKYTQQGHIRYGYTLTETEVQFYVEDTGEGMDECKLQSIFDRFVQLKTGKKGVGLGLAISKGLATQMGGGIHVISELNKGTTFFVTLPIKRQNTDL